MKQIYLKILLIIFLSTFLTSCKGFFKYAPAKDTPVQGEARAKRNVEEGKGISVNRIFKGRKGGTNYEFNTSNPLWRASLEILDFIPLTSVNYSGGIIITDWYSDGLQSDALKITVRFLSNEIASDSLRIIVHERKCTAANNCIIKELNSTIKDELRISIIKRAALIQSETNTKKK